jgi:hypothetical protein
VAVIATGDGAPVSVQELEALAADYELLRGSQERSLRGGDRIRAVLFGADGQPPAALPTKPSWSLCAGRMHLDGTSTSGTPLEQADGQFALVGYDAVTDEAVIANDPFGMHSVFVVERPGRTYVSTSAMVLARHLRCPVSRLGLQGFLVSGYSFGARTSWVGVRRLEPATSLVLGVRQPQERTYWRPAVDSSVSSLGLADAVSHSIDVARDTCAERLTGREYWADLTGGFDSRLLCLLLDAAGVSFATNTRAPAPTDDVHISAELAATTGWPWYDATLPATWPVQLPDQLLTALGWGDAQLEVLQLARVLHVHRQLGGQRPGLLSAGGGEHFQFYAWQPEFLAAGRSTTVHLDRWVDMIALKPVDHSVLQPGARALVREDFRERFSARLEPYRDALNTTQSEMLYAYKSTGHFGAYRSSDGAFLTAELPFYFKPIFSTAFSLHHKHRNRHLLMRHMIARLNPRVADVRTTRGGPATPWSPANAHRFLPYYGILGRKAFNKLSDVGLGRPLLLPQRSIPWEAAAHSAVLSSPHGKVLLDPGSLRIAPLLEPRGLGDLVEASLRPGFSGGAMLGRLLTAELALRATDTVLEA